MSHKPWKIYKVYVTKFDVLLIYIDTLEAQTRAIADWLIGNWRDYFLKTSSKPGVSTSQDLLKKTIGGILSSGTNEALQKLGKSAAKGLVKSLAKGGLISGATIIGGTIGNVPGAIIGFLAGVIIDVCVNLVWDCFTPNGEALAVMKTNDAVNKFMNDVQRNVITKREEQIKLLNTFAENSRDAISKHENKEELLEALNALRNTTKSIQPIDTENRSLSNNLLKSWVKENAGDDADDPNKYGAAEEQWEDAVKHLQEKKNLPKGDGIVGQLDVFVYQLGGELERLGLNTKSTAYATLAKKVEAMKDTSTATQIINKFDKYQLTFSKKDVVKMKDFIAHCDYTCDYGDMSKSAIISAYEKGSLTFKITIQLTKDESSVFIDSFEYFINFHDADLEWHTLSKASWSEDID